MEHMLFRTSAFVISILASFGAGAQKNGLQSLQLTSLMPYVGEETKDNMILLADTVSVSLDRRLTGFVKQAFASVVVSYESDFREATIVTSSIKSTGAVDAGSLLRFVKRQTRAAKRKVEANLREVDVEIDAELRVGTDSGQKGDMKRSMQFVYDLSKEGEFLLRGIYITDSLFGSGTYRSKHQIFLLKVDQAVGIWSRAEGIARYSCTVTVSENMGPFAQKASALEVFLSRHSSNAYNAYFLGGNSKFFVASADDGRVNFIHTDRSIDDAMRYIIPESSELSKQQYRENSSGQIMDLMKSVNALSLIMQNM